MKDATHALHDLEIHLWYSSLFLNVDCFYGADCDLFCLPLMAGFVGTMIMLPAAMFFGELFSYRDNTVGFLDRTDLHGNLYMGINLFAGEYVQAPCGPQSGLYLMPVSVLKN